MKKIWILLVFICLNEIVYAQSFSNHNYTYSDSVFNNPERGFYRYTERTDVNSTLSLSTLQSYRDQGYTLIYRIFYLRDYVNTSISNTYLEKIREDFSKMRAAGIKGVVRFAYTASMKAPYGDATPDQVNSHIRQLKPILTENSDVILVLQAGFIGAWGEWYYTDHFATGSPSNITAEDLQERKALVYNLLDAIPKDRMVQLRYVGYKMKIFDSIPVTIDDAYSGTPKSRISHHNDCFASSDNDVGTYKYIRFEKNYLENDSKYTSVGGETCAYFEPRSNCDTSTYEMERFHWSFINQDYFGQTIDNWSDNGCYTEIQKRLGYRYYLLDSKIQDSCKQGSSVSVSFKLVNYGYSNPINPRDVEIVIKNKANGQLFVSKINTELRKFELNTNIEISAQVGIPSFIPNGEYEVYLNMPDPRPTLKNIPEYSIRLANVNTWEPTSGFNSLKHNLIINDNASFKTSYSGSNYFMVEKNMVENQGNIMVDGNPSDWNSIAEASSVASNNIFKSCKLYNRNDTLYCLMKGINLNPNAQVFIDGDLNSNTGMNYYSWSNDDGMDYLIQNAEIFKYNGPNGSSDWNWGQLSNQLLFSANDSVIELGIPVNLFSSNKLNDILRLGIKNVSADWASSEAISQSGDNLILYQFLINQDFPELYLTSFCNNNILSFAPEEQDSSSVYIIERSTIPDNNFSSVALLSGSSNIVHFYDTELVNELSYNYRLYRIRGDKLSPYSEVKTATAAGCTYTFPEIIIDGNDQDWNAISPIGAASENNKDCFLKTHCDANYLYFLLSVDSITNSTLFIDADNNPQTGEINPNWKSSGFDFKCVNNSLFKFESGNFVKLNDIDSYIINERAVELKIPLEPLGIVNTQAYLSCALNATSEGLDIQIPFGNRNSLLYERVIPSIMPANFSVRNSVSNPGTKLIASWNRCDDCVGYILTRTNLSTQETIQFVLSRTTSQLIDAGLQMSTAYEYSVYSYNFSGKSETAGPLGISTLTGIGGSESTMFTIWPNPVKDELHIKFMAENDEETQVKIYSIDGRTAFAKSYKTNELPAGHQQVNISTVGLEKGIYFVKMTTQNRTVIVKKIVIE